MTLPTQLSFFHELTPKQEQAEESSRANLGTFQDSLRAPIHRWFTYPAGFSFKAVEETFRLYNMKPGMTVYDPFAGTATTNVVARQCGIDSFGVEAHPFVYCVGRTKLFWDFVFPDLRYEIDALIARIRPTLEQEDMSTIPVTSIFPELVCKCYSHEKLARLYLCRQAIKALPPTPFQDFAKLGLTNLLRSIADVATGWPYIAPQKAKKVIKTNGDENVVERLRDQLYQMYSDVREMQRYRPIGQANLIFGDSRQRQASIQTASVDLIFTSPPYLNNYDYSDRTRLEMYFWGEAASWGDITQKVRRRLIMSATTQIARSHYNETQLLSEEFLATAPGVVTELAPKITQMSERRLGKGGKKSYDIMVAGYFNDMLKVFQEAFRVLKPGGAFLLILGDSAPYGVHIPTDTYLGELGCAIGFARYRIEDLRTRGGKWKDNPQRHKVALKESILTVEKD
jgi:DNA modification methylase